MEPDILDGFVPMNLRLAVQPKEAETVRASGLVIPEQAQEKPQEGRVIAVSDRLADQYQVGDEVVYSKYGGVAFEQNGEEVILLSDTDVLLRKPIS